MAHAIQFLTAAIKDVPASICDSQLAAIESVRAIFTNGWLIKSSPRKKKNNTTHTKTRSAGKVPNTHFQGWPRKPHGHNFRGCITEKVNQYYKKHTEVTINSADDQEPIARRTRSSIDTENLPTIQAIQNLNEPIAKRTRYSTVTQKYNAPSN